MALDKGVRAFASLRLRLDRAVKNAKAKGDATKSLFWNKLEIKQKNFENILRKIEEKVWREWY